MHLCFDLLAFRQGRAGICQWVRVPGLRQPMREDGRKQPNVFWPGKTRWFESNRLFFPFFFLLQTHLRNAEMDSSHLSVQDSFISSEVNLLCWSLSVLRTGLEEA